MTRHRRRGQIQWPNLKDYQWSPKESRPGFEVLCILTPATKSNLFHNGKTVPCQQEHSILPVQNQTIILTVVQLYKPASKLRALSACSGYNLWVWICWSTRGGRNAGIRFQGGGAVLLTPGDSPADRSAFNHSVLKGGCEPFLCRLLKASEVGQWVLVCCGHLPSFSALLPSPPPSWYLKGHPNTHKSLMCIFKRQNS